MASPEPPGQNTIIVTSSMMATEPTQYEPRDHYLVLVQGSDVGLRLKLTDRPITLGRNAGCDHAIPDPRVSGRHCGISLRHLDASVRVEDFGSTNGTFVDGVRVSEPASLPPGGLLRMGSHLWRHEHLTRAEGQRAQDLQNDLRKARHYVESLLPAPIAEGPVLTDWSFVPSMQLGGDAFGYHALDAHSFAGYLIDVSGHGAGAAMHSVSVMNVMRQRALPGCDVHDPAQVLNCLNAMFQMEAHAGSFFSIWYGVYDIRSRLLRYASAGHHPSYLVSADRTTMEPLRTRNIVIGAKADHRFEAAEIMVPADATLYVFSDGVFEHESPLGAQLGLPDFLPVLRQPKALHGGESRRILDTVRAIARPGPFDDDFTMLAVTFPASF